MIWISLGENFFYYFLWKSLKFFWDYDFDYSKFN